MRDDEIRERLRDRNPWWRAAAAGSDVTAWTGSDQMLRARSSYDLGYRSKLLDDVATGPLDDKLVVLRGARRVGKSVLLKDTAARVCARGDIDARQLVYVPADGMRASDLNRLAKLGRELTRSIGEERRIWLLDEVTGVPEWTQTLKYLRDNTEMGRDTVICTGSSWDADADLERDLLAGRAGSSAQRRTRILHPMSFRDVLAVSGRDVPLPVALPPWALQDRDAREAAESLGLFVSDLDLAWQSYLTSGGFPRAVAEHQHTGVVGEAFLADLVAWLHRDVDPESGEDSVPRLLSALQTRSCSPLNRRGLAAELGYGSSRVAEVRLVRLVRSYAAIWCHQVDEEGRRVAGAQSKLYLCDPLLASLPSQLRAGLPPADFTRLTETALAVALARTIDRLQPGRWQEDDSIGYLRTSAGKEIDLAPVPVPSASGTQKTAPIEAKWVAAGWRAEARVIDAKFGAGVLATRTILDTSRPVWALPAPVLALLLE